MPRRRDFGITVGQKFNRWTVVELEHAVASGNQAALCRCDCGTERVVPLFDLDAGRSKSCGCFNLEQILERNYRHGVATHPLYHTHFNMMARCYTPTANQYKDWGGRGIKVYKPWHDITVFIKWIEENLGPRPEGMSLDRIDNDGNYEPGNLRWATRYQQVHNRRNSKTKESK